MGKAGGFPGLFPPGIGDIPRPQPGEIRPWPTRPTPPPTPTPTPSPPVYDPDPEDILESLGCDEDLVFSPSEDFECPGGKVRKIIKQQFIEAGVFEGVETTPGFEVPEFPEEDYPWPPETEHPTPARRWVFCKIKIFFGCFTCPVKGDPFEREFPEEISLVSRSRNTTVYSWIEDE